MGGPPKVWLQCTVCDGKAWVCKKKTGTCKHDPLHGKVDPAHKKKWHNPCPNKCQTRGCSKASGRGTREASGSRKMTAATSASVKLKNAGSCLMKTKHYKNQSTTSKATPPSRPSRDGLPAMMESFQPRRSGWSSSSELS